MNLIIDIGNSYVKCYAFDNSTIVDKVISFDLTDPKIVQMVESHHFAGVIIASTRGSEIILPDVIAQIEKVIIFNSQTPIPICNHYQSATLGMDRLAAAVAACSMFADQDVVIFDFGTALTIDFVYKEGYIGGNISAGLSMRFKALNQFSGALPLCHADETFFDIGTTTNQAIVNGVMNSMKHEIEGYMRQNSDKIIIFTGGEAKYFVKQVKMTIFADYELVPRGLNRILEYNEEQI